MTGGQDLWPVGTQVQWLDDVDHSQANQDLEQELGEQVGRGDRPPLVRIWRSGGRLGIGLSRRDLAMGAGEHAAAALRHQGCDVVVRQTGGTAVPQGPGVIHLSYLFPRTRSSGTTDGYYRLLTAPLRTWLHNLGVSAVTGPLPGSYCDGSYNLLVRDQKLVGTAQAWRGGLAGVHSTRPGYILAHACMTVDVDLAWATQQMNQFYEQSGQPYRVHLQTSVTLRQVLPNLFADKSPRQCVDWVAEQWLQFFGAWVSTGS
ncbi:ligase [Alicyclobacillaceae bacterium I2511]|nr:ligase [Alicyclobacillaceae bacterium I2511]